MSTNCRHFCRLGTAKEVVQELERIIVIIEALSGDTSTRFDREIGHRELDEVMRFRDLESKLNKLINFKYIYI